MGLLEFNNMLTPICNPKFLVVVAINATPLPQNL